MRLLLDSNRFIDFCAGSEEVLERFETASLLVVPFVVLAEIRAGAALARRGREQARVLTELLNQPGVRAVFPSEATTHHYAALYAQLRRAGTPIPTNDIWIAALAIEHDLVLYSSDIHFIQIPQIPRLS
jgi:tRNA(fMet)-specific endonuclease VapC